MGKRKKPPCERAEGGGFTYDATGKPVFRFVDAVRWFEPEVSAEMPKELVPWYQQTAKMLDMDFYECWMALMAKSFVLTADNPITIGMVVADADAHRADPTYPVDFSSQLKDSLSSMGDRERILGALRAEVENFDAYVKARTEWLKKQTEALMERVKSETTFA